MKLERFTGVGVHGFLNFDLEFNNDLTFLTGINGSGKTSALNAVVGLLSPNLTLLADLEYERISLRITSDDGRITISASSSGERVTIKTSKSKQVFEYNRYVGDPDQLSYKQSEHEAEYYRDLLIANSSNPTLRVIAALPNPMFLGLDRRSRFYEESRRVRYQGTSRVRQRNAFGGSLTGSVTDAAQLAQDRNREALIKGSQFLEALQKEMMLSLLTVIPGEAGDFVGIKLPTRSDRTEILSLRKNLANIAEILRLPLEEVRKRVTPLLDQLEKAASQIPEGATIDAIFGKSKSNQDVAQSAFSWSANYPHLSRIKQVSKLAEGYNASRREVLAPIERYRSLVNSFLQESGKELEFDERGELQVRITAAHAARPITYLSSGEAQIFVLLTHLTFNPFAASNNVVIIDEPELSLHVHWQELFVDSILSANSNMQYILATHSPSIILDRIEKCIEASGAVGRS